MGYALDVEWLGGQLVIERGTFEDYRELERFHYLTKRPAVRAGVWRVRYVEQFAIENRQLSSANCLNARCVAVGVLGYPTPSCAARQRTLRLRGARYARRKIRWLNANLRTISRVIVHPQFRGVGVASELVRVICADSGVRYVEAMATMGRVVPFFEKGGMRRIDAGEDRPVYYLWDRDRVMNNSSGGAHGGERSGGGGGNLRTVGFRETADFT